MVENAVIEVISSVDLMLNLRSQII